MLLGTILCKFGLICATRNAFVRLIVGRDFMGVHQCDHIVAETPNLDVLGIEMSLIFGKCRLAFFGVFKPKRAIFMAFFYLD